MELVIFLIFAYGVYRAWQDSKAAYRKSKAAYMAKAGTRFPNAPKSRRAATALRHDAGYWASQVLHAFPETRHGFAAGWHRGRAAQTTARTAAEEARTQRLENQADHAESLSGFRARQQEALRRWQAAMDSDRERVAEGTVTEEGREGSRQPGEYGAPYSWDHPDPPGWAPWLDTEARGRHRHADENPTPTTTTDADGTTPGTGDEPPEPGDAQSPAEPGEATATETATESTPSGTPTQGDQHMASDITYDVVLQNMDKEKAGAEQRAAEQQQAAKDAGTMADNMQALEVDPATLGAVADHLDAHEEAVKALQRVRESAENVEAALKRGHAGLSEAHKDAPVAAADRDFYAA
jgi:hypothetical protein